MISKIRQSILDFMNSDKTNPIICGLAIGLYPLLYYYDQNFTLINSWNQLAMFILVFILIPIGLCYIAQKIVKLLPDINILKFGLSILSFVYFLCLVSICVFELRLKMLALAGLIGVVLGFLFYKRLNKFVVFQLLLALVALPKTAVTVSTLLNSDMSWMEQPDAIVEAVFKKTPNIYVIQPDGYANFSELKGGNYSFDNSDFESFLEEKGFTFYPNFRSNYFSTLGSNSSMFSMKHHYYNDPKSGANEVYNARNVIVGENPVVKTFKNNGYTTNLLLEKPYLLVNKPKLGYDFCNIDETEISFLARGFEDTKDVFEALRLRLQSNSKTPEFYFIEKIIPGHINTIKKYSLGKEKERENYLEKVKKANTWLEKVVHVIDQEDPNALIVIVADHGGFVGMDYTLQCRTKQTDPELIKSIFTSMLAIKWPEGKAPDFDNQLKTNVNLFRVLITYLSENETLLNHLQPDRSYAMIQKDAPFGVYEYIDEDYETVFKLIQE